jgi:hypothetical protein
LRLIGVLMGRKSFEPVDHHIQEEEEENGE